MAMKRSLYLTFAVLVFAVAILAAAKPTISSLLPASAAAGGAAFTLTVNGTDYASGAVVRWNGSVAGDRYAELLSLSGTAMDRVINIEGAAEALASKLEEMAAAAGLSKSLSEAGIQSKDLEMLAADAAQQWTGRHNPRPFDHDGALEVYEWAY